MAGERDRLQAQLERVMMHRDSLNVRLDEARHERDSLRLELRKAQEKGTAVADEVEALEHTAAAIRQRISDELKLSLRGPHREIDALVEDVASLIQVGVRLELARREEKATPQLVLDDHPLPQPRLSWAAHPEEPLPQLGCPKITDGTGTEAFREGAPKDEETFAWDIEFKSPDGCGQFAYWADREKRTALVAAGIDEEMVTELIHAGEISATTRFFEHGEYGHLELKLKRDGTGTARLVPRDEP